MDHLQEIATSKLTILDSDETALSCNGYAEFEKDTVFKNSIKVHNYLHVNKGIRSVGPIIPLNDTISLGTMQNQWLEIYGAEGNFNSLNVDVLNVNKINNLECKEIIHEHIVLNDIIKNFDISEKKITIMNLSKLSKTYTQDLLIDFSHNEIDIIINLPNRINDYKKIIIINPNKLRIEIKNKFVMINNNNSYQIYEFFNDGYEWYPIYIY